MKIEQQQVGTVDVFTPMGPLVDQDAETFSKALLTRVKSPTPRIVLAMQEVPYVDSAAWKGFSPPPTNFTSAPPASSWPTSPRPVGRSSS